MNQLYLASAILLTAGGLWWHGHSVGVRATEAEYNERMLAEVERTAELRRRLNQSEALRVERMSELLELRRQLDEQALQDPDAGDRSLGASSLRRLNQIRRTD